jgi:predicted RNA methylase
MSERITEASLYSPIIQLFREVAERYGIRVTGIEEVSTGRIYPDISLQLDGHKLLIQVKIDGISKLMEDIVKTYPIARGLNADLVGILFSPQVREVAPTQLEEVKPRLHTSRALILTKWFSGDLEDTDLLHVINSIIEKFVEFQKTLVPTVEYLTIAKVAREVVEVLSNALRRYMGVQKYFDMAQAIIGRFDFYRSLLEEFVDREEVMKAYVADIIAYLVVLQLLFAHTVSVKKRGRSVLPEISDPFSTPEDLFEKIEEEIRSSGIYEEYKDILGSLLYLLQILREVNREDTSPLRMLGQYAYVIKVLRPEHVKEELFGRIYQESLPQETRKNLGAFFTKPRAARILAELAVDRWDEKVLDPACGSGTLLVAAYRAKMRKAKERGFVDEDELHREFAEKHIYGVDIMQFAKELTTINLALQNLRVKVTPKIYFGDGIAKMVHAITSRKDDPLPVTLIEYFEEMKKKYEELELPRENIDVVIMNPPFTRRERIPEAERNNLEKMLGELIRGKVGYWAYFFAAADNIIKLNGKLASVTPEEFFAGASAESVRRFLFLGEVYDRKSNAYIKKYNRVYVPRVLVRSSVEIAFSEGAHYRDYLSVFEKHLESGSFVKPLAFIVLNRRLEDVANMELLSRNIREFVDSRENFIATEEFTARKIHNIDIIITKHIGNLKPLVGLNSIEAQKHVLELLEVLSHHPTLRDYEDIELIRIRDYNPGQYITRGVEDYARRLFISRYKGRGKTSFVYIGETTNTVRLTIKRHRGEFEISKLSCIHSLRTPAGVRHIDITGEEEYAIINPQAIPNNLLRMAGLIDRPSLSEACNDLKQAYRDLAGNILLVRRVRLTSPNIYWLTFFSNNKIIGPSAPMICVSTEKLGLDGTRLLALYLNSSIALLQLLAYAVETEGAWVALRGDQVWSHIHIPNVLGFSSNMMQSALNIFNKIGKVDVPPLYQRIREKHELQRQIDEMSLNMLGLTDWINKLDEIYNAILKELDIMQEILEKSQRRSEEHVHTKRRQKEKQPHNDVTTPLDKWL